MTHITQAQLDEWKRDAEKATPGPWEVDDLQNEGDYGNGEDVHSGFTSYVVCAGNKSVVDTLNSDLAMVEVDGDCDENGPRSWAWDETGRRNATHIANASPANFLALIAALEEAREALKPFAEFAPKVEQFVDGTATFGGSPIMPTKAFSLADFRRAAKAGGVT